MKYKIKEIKTNYWVQLGRMPMNNGKTQDQYVSDQIDYYHELLKVPYGSPAAIANRKSIYSRLRYVDTYRIKRNIKALQKPRWVKVVGTRDGLKYRGYHGYPTTFYAKWVTKVAKSKSETREI